MVELQAAPAALKYRDALRQGQGRRARRQPCGCQGELHAGRPGAVPVRQGRAVRQDDLPHQPGPVRHRGHREGLRAARAAHHRRCQDRAGDDAQEALERQQRPADRGAGGLGAARPAPARASGSASSTPASTTPTPTSVAPGTDAAYDARQGAAAPSRPPPRSSAATTSPVTHYDATDDGRDRHGPDARRQPAGLQRSRLARRRHRRRLRRDHRRAHLRTGRRPLRTTRLRTRAFDQSDPAGHVGIGPGVAPLADLYALKVFGCEGSTDLVGAGPGLGGRPQR